MDIQTICKVISTLDTLALSLADYDHVWSDTERNAYENSFKALTKELRGRELGRYVKFDDSAFEAP